MVDLEGALTRPPGQSASHDCSLDISPSRMVAARHSGCARGRQNAIELMSDFSRSDHCESRVWSTSPNSRSGRALVVCWPRYYFGLKLCGCVAPDLSQSRPGDLLGPRRQRVTLHFGHLPSRVTTCLSHRRPNRWTRQIFDSHLAGRRPAFATTGWSRGRFITWASPQLCLFAGPRGPTQRG